MNKIARQRSCCLAMRLQHTLGVRVGDGDFHTAIHFTIHSGDTEVGVMVVALYEAVKHGVSMSVGRITEGLHISDDFSGCVCCNGLLVGIFAVDVFIAFSGIVVGDSFHDALLVVNHLCDLLSMVVIVVLFLKIQISSSPPSSHL